MQDKAEIGEPIENEKIYLPFGVGLDRYIGWPIYRPIYLADTDISVSVNWISVSVISVSVSVSVNVEYRLYRYWQNVG